MNSTLDRHHYCVRPIVCVSDSASSPICTIQIIDGWIDGSVMTWHSPLSSRVKGSHKFILQNEKHVILDTSILRPLCTLQSSPLIGTHCNTSHSGLRSPTLSMLLTLGTSSLLWPSGTILSRMLIMLSIRVLLQSAEQKQSQSMQCSRVATVWGINRTAVVIPL